MKACSRTRRRACPRARQTEIHETYRTYRTYRTHETCGNTDQLIHQNIMMDQSIVCGPLFAVLVLPPCRYGESQIIEQIHREYLAAGADIIETNTFNATAISQEDFGLQKLVAGMNRTAAQLAKSAVAECMTEDPSRRRYVAGSIGPLNRTLSISRDVNDPGKRDVTWQQVTGAYGEQAQALLEGGVDLLLVETTFDTLNLKAALFGIEEVFAKVGYRVPLMASGTITDASGRTLTGQTTEAFWISISHAPLLSVGLNCALGPKELRPYIEELSRVAPIYVSCYPNAGLPDPLSPTGFPETPESLAPQLKEWAELGWLNIVGGCCGTTPEHIAALAELVRGLPPRKLPEKRIQTRLSGLEPYQFSSTFTVIGERTNITGSPKFSKLILAGDFDAALAVARQQVEGGAGPCWRLACNAFKVKALLIRSV